MLVIRLSHHGTGLAPSFYVSMFDTQPHLDDMLMLPESVLAYDDLPTRPLLKVRGRRRRSVPTHWNPPLERLDRRRGA